MDHAAVLDVNVEIDVSYQGDVDTYCEYLNITLPNSRLMSMTLKERHDLAIKIAHQFVHVNTSIQGTVKDVRVLSENLHINHDTKSTQFVA